MTNYSIQTHIMKGFEEKLVILVQVNLQLVFIFVKSF